MADNRFGADNPAAAEHLAELRRERPFPAVSVLMPTVRSKRSSAENRARLRSLVGEARRRLGNGGDIPSRTATEVAKELDAAAADVDFDHPSVGLALFAAKGEHHTHALAIPVDERVVVGHSFATRDLVEALTRVTRYWALVLAEQPTRLWEGQDDALTEVTTDGFPMGRDVPGGKAINLAEGYGKQLAAARDEWHRQLLRDVDAALGAVLARDPRPVVVIGVDRLLACFDEVGTHREAIVGRIEGSHADTRAGGLAPLVEPVLREYEQRSREAVVQELEASRDGRRYATGLPEIWQLLRRGNGARLLVERGYRAAGRIDGDRLKLLDEPAESAVPESEDVVDEVIEAALGQGGNVTFVDDGRLADSGRIALVTRY